MHATFVLAAPDVTRLLGTALFRTAPDGARVIALHWLYALCAARDAWQHALDREASEESAEWLHKARVGLRRLRATLHEHRVGPGPDEGRRIRRALRLLNAATGDVRDRDVQRAWLEAQRNTLALSARDEADRLRVLLGEKAHQRNRRVRRAFEKHLDPHVAHLVRRLSQYVRVVPVGRESSTTLFGAHLADRVRAGLERTLRDLDAARQLTASDTLQRRLHRLRIQLKRQRAMLATCTSIAPDIHAWFLMATDGQDALGALHDAALLADRAEAHGMASLAAALRSVGVDHLDRFRAQWLDASETVRRVGMLAVSALEASVATTAISTLPEVLDGFPMPSGHGLPVEIERKFLLHGLPPQAAMSPSLRIEQGWLPGNVLRERLRRSIGANGDVQHTRTIKLGRPGARIEIEEPAEPALFDALWPHTIDARIRKRRHLVVEGAVTWEIDVFLDRDLVLAEVELKDSAQVVELPAWLAPFVVREVTHDPSYLNAVMAQRDMASPDRDAR